MPRLIKCRRCGHLTQQGSTCTCAQQPPPPRSSTTARGYDSWWKTYSERFRRQHPYCVACLARGIYSTACLVDHTIPFHRGDGSIDEFLRRDPANHQSLCDHSYHDCHGLLKKPLETRFRDNPQRLKIGWERLLEQLRQEQRAGCRQDAQRQTTNARPGP